MNEVLIKMEMPKSCAFCRFYGAYCYAKGDEDVHSILPCPLIPVQEHGRLIDADALHKLFEDQWHYLQVLDWNENPTAEAKQSGINWCINTMHDEAPTVIPASGNYNEGDSDAKLLTNQVAMTRLSPEEFYNKMDWLLHRYGTQFNSTRLAVIDWLKQEVE